MNRFKHSLALLALAAVPALAQDPSFEVGLAIVEQLDTAKNITNANSGLALSAAYYVRTKGDYTLRFGLGLNSLSGNAFSGALGPDGPTTLNGVELSLTGTQVHADLMVPSPWKKTTFVTGLSLQQWSYKATLGKDSINHLTGDRSTSGTIKGLKFGLRLGIQVAFTPNWVGELLLQQTELGSNGDGDKTKGNLATTPYEANENPAWLQLGVRYRF